MRVRMTLVQFLQSLLRNQLLRLDHNPRTQVTHVISQFARQNKLNIIAQRPSEVVQRLQLIANWTRIPLPHFVNLVIVSPRQSVRMADENGN
jgi:hypothetical protein